MDINCAHTVYSSIGDRWIPSVDSHTFTHDFNRLDLLKKVVNMVDLPVETPNFSISIVKEEDFMKHKIKKVVFNDPATVVFWTDNTKTVVKCGKNETYDPEKGLAMAICKKYFGNEGNYYNEFKKWLPKTDKNEDI